MKAFRKSLFLQLGILSLVLLNLRGACNSPAATPSAAPQATEKPIIIETFQDLKVIFEEIRESSPVEAQTRADQLWQTLVQSRRVPLVLGAQVVFFYKGEAQQVNWRGSFNGWNAPGLEGFRAGNTDLWVGNMEMPEASRAEYKIVLNGRDWLVDPVNPKTAFSGLTGVNNVVTLPGFHVTDESRKRNDIKPGDLRGDLSIDSRSLGYTVNYWVYTPVGYENLRQLQVLCVLDGNDFVDERMGALPNVLDNLIASGRIQPVLAVLIDAREPGNPQHNRREEEFLVHPVEHAQFIADELVPLIDRTYWTDPRPEARVIMGVSYGGLSASYIAASRSDVFHHLAAFSPSFWVLDNPQSLSNQEQKDGSQLMLSPINAVTECGGETGFLCPRLPIKIFMSVGLANWDVGDFSRPVKTLEQQGYPIELHQVREGHTWHHWRGISDEMLTYFFGVSDK